MSAPSLREIQVAYFDGLERMFGGPFSQMKKHDVDCAEIAADMASREQVVAAFEHDREAFFGELSEFWDRYRDLVDRKLSELTCLKTMYGGDLSPSYVHNIATSAGLYMDTIVIPDPLLRIADFGEALTPKGRLYFTAKHALNALTYRELALAEVEPPIVVIIGDALDSNRPKLREPMSSADVDLLSHFGRIFDRSFASQDELTSFLAQFASIEQLAAAVSDSSRVLFDLDWPGDPLEQIRGHLKITGSRFNEAARSLMHDRPPGLLVTDFLKGRLMQVNDIIISSERINGTPLVDAPTSWQYLIWKYEYDIARRPAVPVSAAHLLIMRALQSVNDDDRLRVLKASPEDLIALRRNGVLADLRELLRTSRLI